MSKTILEPSPTDALGQIVDITLANANDAETVDTSLWWVKRRLIVLSGSATLKGRMEDTAPWTDIGTYSAGASLTPPSVTSYQVIATTSNTRVILAAIAQQPLGFDDISLRLMRSVQGDNRILSIRLLPETQSLDITVPQNWVSGFQNKNLATITAWKTLNTLSLLYKEIEGQSLSLSITATGSQRPVPDGDFSALEQKTQPNTATPSAVSIEPEGTVVYQLARATDLPTHVNDLIAIINHQTYLQFLLSLLFPDIDFTFRAEEL